MNNTTAATISVGTAYHSRLPVLSVVGIAQSLVVCVVFGRLLFVHFILATLCCLTVVLRNP